MYSHSGDESATSLWMSDPTGIPRAARRDRPESGRSFACPASRFTPPRPARRLRIAASPASLKPDPRREIKSASAGRSPWPSVEMRAVGVSHLDTSRREILPPSTLDLPCGLAVAEQLLRIPRLHARVDGDRGLEDRMVPIEANPSAVQVGGRLEARAGGP